MTERWTPGPWRIGEPYEDDEGYREIPIQTSINGRDYTPASVCLQFPPVPGMQDANAALIATAPRFADIAARAQYLANERGGDYGALSKDELCAFMAEFDAALSDARDESGEGNG